MNNTYQFWMCLDNVRDTLSGERLFAEPALDIVKHLCMARVRLVQDIFETDVRRPEAVAEVLCKNPTAICGSA